MDKSQIEPNGAKNGNVYALSKKLYKVKISFTTAAHEQKTSIARKKNSSHVNFTQISLSGQNEFSTNSNSGKNKP